MLNRPAIAISVDSFIRLDAAGPHSHPEVDSPRPTQLVAAPMCNTPTAHRFVTKW